MLFYIKYTITLEQLHLYAWDPIEFKHHLRPGKTFRNNDEGEYPFIKNLRPGASLNEIHTPEGYVLYFILNGYIVKNVLYENVIELFVPITNEREHLVNLEQILKDLRPKIKQTFLNNFSDTSVYFLSYFEDLQGAIRKFETVDTRLDVNIDIRTRLVATRSTPQERRLQVDGWPAVGFSYDRAIDQYVFILIYYANVKQWILDLIKRTVLIRIPRKTVLLKDPPQIPMDLDEKTITLRGVTYTRENRTTSTSYIPPPPLPPPPAARRDTVMFEYDDNDDDDDSD